MFHTRLMQAIMASNLSGQDRESKYFGKARKWDSEDLRLFRRAPDDIVPIELCVHDGVLKAIANDPHLKR